MKDKIKNIPIIKQIWSNIRKSKIIKKHIEVANFWKPYIQSYYSGNLQKFDVKAKKDLDNTKIIWQYWGQGVDNETLPEVVKICFNSVDKFKGDYDVVRISDSNFSDYLEIPDFIIEKLDSGIISRTFFSDFLRLALLSTYGGVWLDATILLTGPLDSSLASLPYFMFQRDVNEPNKKNWEASYAAYWGWDKLFKVKVLNSIIYSQKGNSLISDLLQLLLNYWNKQNEVIDYFFFQILYNELIEGPLKDEKCKLISDVYPHVLQTKFNGTSGLMENDDLLKVISTHKMSYFDENGVFNLRKFVND